MVAGLEQEESLPQVVAPPEAGAMWQVVKMRLSVAACHTDVRAKRWLGGLLALKCDAARLSFSGTRSALVAK